MKSDAKAIVTVKLTKEECAAVLDAMWHSPPLSEIAADAYEKIRDASWPAKLRAAGAAGGRGPCQRGAG